MCGIAALLVRLPFCVSPKPTGSRDADESFFFFLLTPESVLQLGDPEATTAAIDMLVSSRIYFGKKARVKLMCYFTAMSRCIISNTYVPTANETTPRCFI